MQCNDLTYVCKYYEMITNIRLLNTSITSHNYHFVWVHMCWTHTYIHTHHTSHFLYPFICRLTALRLFSVSTCEWHLTAHEGADILEEEKRFNFMMLAFCLGRREVKKSIILDCLEGTETRKESVKCKCRV